MFIDLLSSNEFILKFYHVQLDRFKLGGIDDLVNNIILLIGNVLYRRKNIVFIMSDNGVIKRISKCFKDYTEERLSLHSVWTLSNVLYYREIPFDDDLVIIL